MNKILIFIFLLLGYSSYSNPDTINIELFNARLLVFKDSNEYKKVTKLDLIPNSICQSSFENGKFAIYIIDKSCLDHELIHITWYILDYYGIKLEVDNNEIQAYLFEYLKNKIK